MADNTSSASLSSRLRRYRFAFALSNFAVGPAFGGFHSYVTFQIQAIGYAIGHEPGRPPGTGCPASAKSCRVPLGSSRDVNLTSFLLYLNAIAYAVAGLLLFLVAGIGDYLPAKREQYISFLVAYGALCLPVAALTALDVGTFNTLSALHVVFAVVGYLSQVWANIFIPYTMRGSIIGSCAGPEVASTVQGERRGLRMSIWGFTALNLSLVIFYVIVLGLTYTAARNAGLSMTTAAGAACILLALVAWKMLPSPDGKALPAGETWWSLSVETFISLARSVHRYPDALRFLIAYTIYNDTHFAFGTVTNTLFNLVVRPSVREFTGYAMLGPAVSLVVGVAWLHLVPHCRLTLRQWSMVCYSVVCLVAVWALLGLSASSRVGLKHRWEFYLVSIVQSAAGAVIVPLFKVLFSQLFPLGAELRWFGFQMVLSCATSWIPQVVNGPIVDATDNPRVPAAVCLPAFLCCLSLAWWTDDERGKRRAIEGQRKVGLTSHESASGGGGGEATVS